MPCSKSFGRKFRQLEEAPRVNDIVVWQKESWRKSVFGGLELVLQASSFGIPPSFGAFPSAPRHHLAPHHHVVHTVPFADLSDVSEAFDTSPCMACMAKPPFQPMEPPFNHIERVSIYGLHGQATISAQGTTFQSR
ncbi:hypothetical protein L3X38_032777 [Prunus dulcis]|uniref:Uncharacterized protein n=1 Tax=Prunus dulcis TaxID=3755 RepID=A0AAD4VER4_PRUDU|nr:hypothetical protein L3X38_032777 [Prunus dulcis]